MVTLFSFFDKKETTNQRKQKTLQNKKPQKGGKKSIKLTRIERERSRRTEGPKTEGGGRSGEEKQED